MGREIDFIVLKNGRPLYAVEAKWNSTQLSKNLKYFSQKISIPYFYQVHTSKEHWKNGQIEVLPFLEFCKKEKLV